MKMKILLIAVMAAATIITRFLPFLIFPAGKKTPAYIDFLGKTLPFATIGLLVVYCLKDSLMGMKDAAAGTVSFLPSSAGIPEFLAAAVIVVLHRWKGNSLLSIGAGTVFYMFLVQSVF